MTWWTQSDTQIKQKDRFIVTIGESLLLTTIKSINKPEVSFDNKTYKLINHEFKYPGIAKWNDITMKFVDPSGGGKGDDFSTSNMLFQILNNTGYAYPYNEFGTGIQGYTGRTTHNIGYNDTKRALTTPEKASSVANSFGPGLTAKADFTNANVRDQNITIIQISPGGGQTASTAGNTAIAARNTGAAVRAAFAARNAALAARTGPIITEAWTLANPIVKSIKFGDLAYDSSDPVEYELTIQYDWAVYRSDLQGKSAESYENGKLINGFKLNMSAQ